jgi:hypothetical protein
MAAYVSLQDSTLGYILDGTIELDTDTIKLALLSSTGIQTPANTVFADFSTDEITGGGYTGGGIALTNVSLTNTDGFIYLQCDNVVFPTLTNIFTYGILYVDATKGAIVKPLIAHISFNDGADLTSAGNNFTVSWTNGIVFAFTWT